MYNNVFQENIINLSENSIKNFFGIYMKYWRKYTVFYCDDVTKKSNDNDSYNTDKTKLVGVNIIRRHWILQKNYFNLPTRRFYTKYSDFNWMFMTS